MEENDFGAPVLGKSYRLNWDSSLGECTLEETITCQGRIISDTFSSKAGKIGVTPREPPFAVSRLEDGEPIVGSEERFPEYDIIERRVA